MVYRFLAYLVFLVYLALFTRVINPDLHISVYGMFAHLTRVSCLDTRFYDDIIILRSIKSSSAPIHVQR